MNTDRREWLETDGLGGFACGPVSGPRTRRYHALLLPVLRDGRRFVLVSGAEVNVETPAGRFALASQAYAGGVVSPMRADLVAFASDPWPRFTFVLPNGMRVEHQVIARRGRAQVLLSWRLTAGPTPPVPVTLRVRLLFAGRDYHALHHENPLFRFAAEARGDRLLYQPYPGGPEVIVSSNGRYRHEPCWYRRFHYAEEAARGLDCEEDLAAPGELELDLGRREALILLAAQGAAVAGGAALEPLTAETLADEVGRGERERRAAFVSPLDRAADAYVVSGAGGTTVVAGYPWFTDWGRDTFVALRGLCLATGRLADAREVLLRWAGALSRGMLPNRFPEGAAAPEYNSVDAALWYVIAVHEYLAAATGRFAPPLETRQRLLGAVEAILAGYAAGTRHRIGLRPDGLLAAGEPGVQLTWMDAKVGDRVVTPRTGKPVEIQALWLNALWIGSRLGTASAARWREVFAAGRASFAARFWSAPAGRLFDVIDVDHVEGAVDASFRPNQIFAVGGLPLVLLERERARAVVDAVGAHLYTPLGLRTLAPGEPGYAPRYDGGVPARDGAYHQGTAWPWLLGAFVEAWVRVRGDGEEVRQDARARFLPPLRRHLEEVGLGHISELCDAEPPHRVGGCPFQAWSLGELLRLERQVLVPDAQRARTDGL
jgi:predicted glycogen debranching enzyme